MYGTVDTGVNRSIHIQRTVGRLWDCCGCFCVFKYPLTTFIPPHPHSFVQQPFTESFPQVEIYELLSPDLLHQLIKGTFKDHLVLWVINYLDKNHTTCEAKRIKDIIDHWYIFPMVQTPPVAWISFSSTAYPSHPVFRDFAILKMDGTLANGLEMIQKC